MTVPDETIPIQEVEGIADHEPPGRKYLLDANTLKRWSKWKLPDLSLVPKDRDHSHFHVPARIEMTNLSASHQRKHDSLPRLG